MFDALGVVDIGRERQVTIRADAGAESRQPAGRRHNATKQNSAISDHAARLAAAIAKQQEQRLARHQAPLQAQEKAVLQRDPARTTLQSQTSTSVRLAPLKQHKVHEAAQYEERLEAQRNEELRETMRRLELKRAAQDKLEALHHDAEVLRESERLAQGAAYNPVSRLAQLNARRAAQHEELHERDRETQRKAIHARTPAWWPREPRLEPPQPPPPQPPTPEMVAAANRRLVELRTKLEAGQRLTPDEESDAAAILELQRIWSAQG